MFRKSKTSPFYYSNTDSFKNDSIKPSKKKVNRKRIRVIAGAYRRQLINTPWSPICRPTLSRCRQSLFDFICHPSSRINDLHNLSIIDLYSGSASLAIESVSRGASTAICVEHDRDCCNIIHNNFKKLNCSDKLQLNCVKVSTWLKNQPIQCDIIFADPPYINRFDSNGWEDHLLPKNIFLWLNKKGLYVLQHHKSVEAAPDCLNLRLIKSLTQGKTTFSIYERR